MVVSVWGVRCEVHLILTINDISIDISIPPPGLRSPRSPSLSSLLAPTVAGQCQPPPAPTTSSTTRPLHHHPSIQHRLSCAAHNNYNGSTGWEVSLGRRDFFFTSQIIALLVSTLTGRVRWSTGHYVDAGQINKIVTTNRLRKLIHCTARWIGSHDELSHLIFLIYDVFGSFRQKFVFTVGTFDVRVDSY